MVINQFACILYFLLNGGLIPSSTTILILELIALSLGIWAIGSISFFNFSIFPEPKTNTLLIKKGPYAIIRHPMYTAILILCIALLMNKFNSINLFIFLILTLNQIIKLNLEENFLVEKFPDYIDYKKQTWRLIPYLY